MLSMNALLIGLCTWLLTRPTPHTEAVSTPSPAASNYRGVDPTIRNLFPQHIAAPSIVAQSPADIVADPVLASQLNLEAEAAAETETLSPASIALQSPDIPLTTDQQVAEWEQLQDTFLAKVNSTIPSTEEARETWQEAQRENDDLFRAKFGDQALQSQQMEAYKEELAPPRQ